MDNRYVKLLDDIKSKKKTHWTHVVICPSMLVVRQSVVLMSTSVFPLTLSRSLSIFVFDCPPKLNCQLSAYQISWYYITLWFSSNFTYFYISLYLSILLPLVFLFVHQVLTSLFSTRLSTYHLSIYLFTNSECRQTIEQ